LRDGRGCWTWGSPDVVRETPGGADAPGRGARMADMTAPGEHRRGVSAHPSHGRPVVAVVGATATGKSDLGVALARELGGEVVNADASQLYRGMDIGTAKLGPEQRLGIPH